MHLNPPTEDIVHTIGSIRPNTEFSYSLKLEGLRLGRHDLVVGLESDKVELVTGEVEVGMETSVIS